MQLFTESLATACTTAGKRSFTRSLKNQNITLIPVALKASPNLKLSEISNFSNAILSPKNDYVTSPLPCGGTYAMLVMAGTSCSVTPPVSVDAEHPLVNQDIEAAVGHDTITGKFVDQSNHPIGYQEVYLTYHPTEQSGFSGYGCTTASDGTFTISDVNLDAPGFYEVDLSGNVWSATKVRIDRKTASPLRFVVLRQAK